MHNIKKILLVGFDETTITTTRQLFPDVIIISIPANFHAQEFRWNLKDTSFIFFNDTPIIYLHLFIYQYQNKCKKIDSDSFSYYEENGFDSLHLWDHFRDKQGIIFAPHQKNCPQTLQELASQANTKCKEQEPTIHISAKNEHINSLAGYLFYQLFSFTSYENTPSPDIERLINIKTIIREIDKIHKSTKKLRHDTCQGDINLETLPSKILNMEKIYETHFPLILKNIHWVNRNFEMQLDDNHQLQRLYSEDRNNYNQWLERNPIYDQPINAFLNTKTKHARWIFHSNILPRPISPAQKTNNGVIILPTPTTSEDRILPICVMLDNLAQRTFPPITLQTHYKQLHKKQFPIEGKSFVMEMLYRQIMTVLNDPSGHVLILGEAGSGKELVAKLIQNWDQKIKSESINCSHLMPELAVSILFGHTKGAFTGADQSKSGLISSRHTGSLFMDEIQSLPAQVMPMLLRYLETGELLPLGATKVEYSKTRIIGASNDDNMLHKDNKERGFISRFRYIIWVPSLKYRKEDIELLSKLFEKQAQKNIKNGSNITLSPGNIDTLKVSDWHHSNVRGLKNAVFNIISHIASLNSSPSTKNKKQAGRHKTFDDNQLSILFHNSKDAATLKQALNNNYQSKAAMRQRISDNPSLKDFFESTFAKDW